MRRANRLAAGADDGLPSIGRSGPGSGTPGYLDLPPVTDDFTVDRRHLPGTNVLETTFRTANQAWLICLVCRRRSRQM
jgi:hypothetical protein